MIAHNLHKPTQIHTHTNAHITSQKLQLIQNSPTKANSITLWISLQSICPPFDPLTCFQKVMAFPSYRDPIFLKQNHPNQGDDHGSLLTPNHLVLSEHLREKSWTSGRVYILAEERFQGCFSSDTETKEYKEILWHGKITNIKIWSYSYWSVQRWAKGKSCLLWRKISIVQNIRTPWGHLILGLL